MEQGMFPGLLDRHRVGRGDELSRLLLRQRARLMAEGVLELALEGRGESISQTTCHRTGSGSPRVECAARRTSGNLGGAGSAADGQRRRCDDASSSKTAQLGPSRRTQSGSHREDAAVQRSSFAEPAASAIPSPFGKPQRPNTPSVRDHAPAAAMVIATSDDSEKTRTKMLRLTDNSTQATTPFHPQPASSDRENGGNGTKIAVGLDKEASLQAGEPAFQLENTVAGDDHQAAKSIASHRERIGDDVTVGLKPRFPTSYTATNAYRGWTENMEVLVETKNTSRLHTAPCPTGATVAVRKVSPYFSPIESHSALLTAIDNGHAAPPDPAQPASPGASVAAATEKTVRQPESVGSAKCFEGEEKRIMIARTPDYSRGEQPAFVVIGLVGQNSDRLLLLPTVARRHEAVGVIPARSVVLKWGDSKSVLLTRTKKKPTVPNPLPALATALSWARGLGSGVFPFDNFPTLPPFLVPSSLPPTASGRDGVGSAPAECAPQQNAPTTLVTNLNPDAYKVCSSVGNVVGGMRDTGEILNLSPDSPFPLREEHRKSKCAQLSIGASWMLSYLTFGQNAGGEAVLSFIGGRRPPSSTVSVAGSEAAALALLACPDIGWAPEPSEIMQAIIEADGTICGYAVDATSIGIAGGETAGEEASGERKGNTSVACDEANTACNELLAAGLCARSKDGGRLRLVPEVELTFQLALKVFMNMWNPSRMTFASIALGLERTGPMMVGILPRTMHSLLATPMWNLGDYTYGLRKEQALTDGKRLRGGVAMLCVKLHTWRIEVARKVGDAEREQHHLWQVVKTEGSGQKAVAVWNGPVAEALAMLGGAVGSGWMEGMSRDQRLSEPACVRLKEAVAEVVEMIAHIISLMQKNRAYGSAVILLRLLVSQDEGQAGPNNLPAPDLAWAASWCTSTFRGWAWTRLAMNLEHLRDGEGCLDALRAACEDSFVNGGARVDVRQRLATKHRQYGDPDETPPPSPFPEESEEQLVTRMKVGKEGNKRSPTGGRLLFFDGSGDIDLVGPSSGNSYLRARDNSSPSSSGGISVEELVLKHSRERGGWAGVHCESGVVMMLMMLLLWEEVFDPEVKAGGGHCLTNQPLDLYDVYFWTRRKGLPIRLARIADYSDKDLWNDIEQRFDRYHGVSCVRCKWRRIPKQQLAEIAVSFGARRLSYVLKALARDVPNLNYGFPDLILWRPKKPRVSHDLALSSKSLSDAIKNTAVSGIHLNRNGRDKTDASRGGVAKPRDRGPWAGKNYGMGWEGEGQGWEVKVVEVKSISDQLSSVQRAWLGTLRDAGVPATVYRVSHEVSQKKRRKS